MSSYYDKQANRNKKRIEILRLDGAKFSRYYDYGTEEFLMAFYGNVFTSDKYIIRIYDIKHR